MRLRVFKDKKGRVLATVEEAKGRSVAPEPMLGKAVQVERISAPKDYTSQLRAFYKSARGRPKRRKSAR